MVILNMDWEDTEQFTIPHSDLVQSSKFIHEGRMGGGSVLVHCAQVSDNRAWEWNESLQYLPDGFQGISSVQSSFPFCVTKCDVM